MARSLVLPLLGVFLAIAITATMDATSLFPYSALPLCPLMVLFWYLERHSRHSMGFVWGQPRDYGLAVLYPILVLGTVTVMVIAAGAADVAQTDWPKARLNFALVTASTILVAMITEEGFFRGWLWAALTRRGQTATSTLLWTSIAFALWHLSAVTLHTGFDLPRAQIPVFMVNAAVMGAVWGLLRALSGSVIVSSVSHGVWNGGAYVLYGFGEKVGALGVKNTAVFGPEVGVLGLALNILFASALWWWWKASTREASK
jgi:hypothetical protein